MPDIDVSEEASLLNKQLDKLIEKITGNGIFLIHPNKGETNDIRIGNGKYTYFWFIVDSKGITLSVCPSYFRRTINAKLYDSEVDKVRRQIAMFMESSGIIRWIFCIRKRKEKEFVHVEYALNINDEDESNKLVQFLIKGIIRTSDVGDKIIEDEFEQEVEMENAMQDKMSKNTILYGPPGTGKTYKSINYSLKILAEMDDDLKIKISKNYDRRTLKDLFDHYSGISDHVASPAQIAFVTFHQSYSYEDFVIGLKPELQGEVINYVAKKGIFMRMCEGAIDHPDKNFVLIIDEINRGNLSSIFGELMTLIEDSKRIDADECIKLQLPHYEKLFGVPSNLYILGTMNTADRSAALIDIALRRRFEFVYMPPDFYNLKPIESADDSFSIISLMEQINRRIEILRDRDHIIGHAFFMSLLPVGKYDRSGRSKALQKIFKNKVIPLLEEYFYEDWDDMRKVLGERFFQEHISVNESKKIVGGSGNGRSVYRLREALFEAGNREEFIAALKDIYVPAKNVNETKG